MLARAYNPVMAAQMVYQRQVEQLNEAHRYGVLSADQLEAKLAELGGAYTRVGADALRAQHFTNQFGAVTHFAGVSTNRFGMVAQQVGYQVGDFFVQVQSGTNAFVAFGQQATQLAGLLPGIYGAIIGIGISVGTMLLATWDRTRRANDEATSATQRYEEALKSMREQAASTRDELAALYAGFEGSQEGSLINAILERQLEMRELPERLRAEFEEANALTLATSGVAVSAEVIAEQNRYIQEQIALLAEANAKDQERLETAQQLREEHSRLQAVTDRVQDLNEENALMEAQLVYMRQGVEIDEARRRAQEDALLRQAMALADSTTATEENRAAAARFVEELVNGFNRARELEAEMKNVGTQSETARRIAESLSRQIGTAADAAIRLRDAMASVGTASMGRLEQATILRAQISAAQRGLSVPGAEAAAQTALQLGRSGATADQIAAAAERARRETETVEALRQQLSDLTSPASGGGSGGGGEQGDIQNTIDSMQRRIEQERTLVSLFGQQRAAMEIYYDLRDANDQADIRMTDERLMRYAEELARQQELLNLERQRESQVQQIGQAFENMFVSAWTGARSLKEALGGLAQQLAQIYAQRAFQQLFGGFNFGRFLPFANGGVIAQGNVVPFADGGVVSRATTFPMASGRTGLMGEAGPEAIMPLRRGADGKLGVAGQTSRVEVVVQLGVPEGVTVQEATTIAGNVAVQVVRAGMRRNQQQLPGQLNALEARGTTR
jgi:phage-related minor tail protein